MHKIISTDAIVLAKRPVGEANVLVTLLSRDLGLVRAQVKSARLAQSKLRYGVEPLTQGRFALLAGRHEWKLTGASELSRRYADASTSRRRALGRISRLLMRLITGEESIPALYASVSEGFRYLARAADERDAESIECVLVLRIMAHLGYLPATPEIAPFIERDFFSLELAAEAARSRALLIRTINESLGASGL